MHPHPEAMPRTILLVEGASDRIAVEPLAARLGRDLAIEGVTIVEMGGATGIGKQLAQFGPSGRGLRIAGLYDAGEFDVVSRNLEWAGYGACLTATALEDLGWFMCVADLEDELIRTVGMPVIEQVVDAVGDLRAFRTFQSQPEWRERPPERQFRRWIGAGARRKTRYAALLVEAMDLARVPLPLANLLRYLASPA